MHRLRWHVILAALTVWLGAIASSPVLGEVLNNRHDHFTQKFERAPDQARVLAAGYLGGRGTEWLVGGGFQPDGTIVVAGVALGPVLELGSTPVTVLGKDASAPAAPQRRQLSPDKAGKPRYEPFSWKHENATAFVVRLSSDLKQIKSASRFPWKAGGLTGAAVDPAGNIYLTGPANEGIRSLSSDHKELPVADNGLKKGSCGYTYLACLSPEADKLVWLRTFKSPSTAPEVEIDRAGKVRFLGPDLRLFDASGEQHSAITVPGGLGPRCAVSPRDRTFVRGGEHPWRTGREPYRDPILNVYKADGQLLYELYNWDGPFVGLDSLRLVSDSAVRLVRFDEDGNLVLYAWSDGGNSVMYREPNDIRKVSKKMDGLGFSAWGANVLSCAHVIKIEPRNYKVAAGTLWQAYLRSNNKPNSIKIDSLRVFGDGSISIAGESAWGVIQTGNNLSGGADPAGTYVALLSKDCSSLRFSSVMPACGKTDVNEGSRWGIVRGTVGGKPRALFVCGAVENEDVYGKVLPAPSVNAVQARFGGGYTDGYLLLLDLSQ